MAFIKHRPSLSLRAPALITPGTEVTAALIVEADREVPIEAITVDLKGGEKVTIGSGSSARTHRRSIVRQRAELSGPRLLPAGSHELRFAFSLPADALPTYFQGGPRVEYVAEARVDIDWWPDATEKFTLRVGHRPPPAGGTEPRPRTYSTSPGGPVGSTPGLEVSLASEVVAAGEPMQVAIGMLNHDPARFNEVRVSLAGEETLFNDEGLYRGTRDSTRHRYTVPMSRVLEGLPIRFELPDVPPTFRGELFHLNWFLDVVGVVSWGRNLAVRLPIEITRPGAVGGNDAVAPAVVGSSRRRAIWEHAAQKHGMHFDGHEMTKSTEHAELVVRLGEDQDGPALVGTLTYPDLHLDLDGGKTSGFHRLFKKSVDLQDPRVGNRHYVAGRDDAQVRAFVQTLGRTLFADDLDDVDDTEMKFISLDRGHAALDRMCRTLRDIAEALPKARAAIPPASPMAAHLSTWLVVATREAATLEQSRMALHFDRGHDQASVITEWTTDGTPYRTTAILHVQDPVDVDYHFLSTGPALPDADAQHYGGEARGLLARLVEDTPHVHVGANTLVAHLEPQLEDPSGAVTILKRLQALYALIRATTGPYR
ncbi:MAG: arrestin family protein [Deltaproteobacteria bacterium]|nr:arrestin family protein [Deltaproteobacteria bacterium]